MRFLENGPSIPDELLNARDEGRVVLFCGAGVSRARAGLPDFFGLAENVIRSLGVPSYSTACKILKEAKEIKKRTGVNGLISADRIFGLLEDDLSIQDIEAAVAKELRPKANVDLSAHQLILDLATTPEGKVQLVTTNFDRLFDGCKNGIQTWLQPRLPDPTRQNEMDGIIYLHGCTKTDYSGSEKDGFILSSSDFGRAYLSDGWATTFFREIIERYIVLFIGYSADDPPVHYLLEALNEKDSLLKGTYAFQAENSAGAVTSWRNKGVEAITYPTDNGHLALWETIGAWAVRAKSPKKWKQSIIELAMKGPENLSPHERGQVAHLISTLEGARLFSESEMVPPAEWLCVFDSQRRYATAMHTREYSSQRSFIDPFDLYGLDTDIIPNKINSDASNSKCEIPANTWDAFVENRFDIQNLRNENYSAIKGEWSLNSPMLSSRLSKIGWWICRVADQTAAVWWAAHQSGIHPDIQLKIRSQLSSKNDLPIFIRKTWQNLFEVWNEKNNNLERDLNLLEQNIAKNICDCSTIRKYAELNRPYLIKGSFSGGPKPPDDKENLQAHGFAQFEVSYPSVNVVKQIPEEWLPIVTSALRKNLEHAVQLETELGGYGLKIESSIIPDDTADIDDYIRTHGLTGYVISFANIFERLIEADIKKAQQEFATWLPEDESVFCKLKIWASGMAELITVQNFTQIITGLSDNAFWNTDNQKDLMLALNKRWNKLQKSQKKVIENKLLSGNEKWVGEEDAEYKERCALASLDRIKWLSENGCIFTFDIDKKIKRLQSFAHTWQPQHANKVVETKVCRFWVVTTNTEYSALLNLPVSQILSKALEQSGRTEDYLIDKDPLNGLAKEHPFRVYSALAYEAKQNGKYPEWAWRKFLNSVVWKTEQPKFAALIAERISSYPDKDVIGIIGSVSQWLLDNSDQLATNFQKSFEKIVSKLINVLCTQKGGNNTGIIHLNKDRDYAMKAINAPAGIIAQAHLFDSRVKNLKEGDKLPVKWLNYVEKLLSVECHSRRHAIVIFTYSLSWFYDFDTNWTETHLLSVLKGSDVEEKEAFWSGFLWAARTPSQELYNRIKPNLLTLAKEQGQTVKGYCEVLAGIILAGWGSMNTKNQDKFITNDEMRTIILHSDENFRANLLSQLVMCSESNDNDTRKKWLEMVPEFLRDVWPRQKSIQTANISAQLVDLALANKHYITEITKIILPLLTHVNKVHLSFREFRETKDNVIDLFPSQTLALLYAILPADITNWPYDIENFLNRISEADPNLNSNEKLLELKRKWNAR